MRRVDPVAELIQDREDSGSRGTRSPDAGCCDGTGDMTSIRRQQRYSDGMAVVISIRNVPEDVRDELAARARRSGRSLQEYLRGLLVDVAALPDPADLMAEVRARKRAHPTALPADRIIALRDEARS